MLIYLGKKCLSIKLHNKLLMISMLFPPYTSSNKIRDENKNSSND